RKIVKKCEQAVTDHEAYLEKYKQCSAWLAAAQARFERCRDGSSVGERQDLVQRSAGLRELLAEQPSATSLLNATVELGEKLYPSTAMEGREDVRQQLQELQQAMETLYDGVSSTERELQAKLSSAIISSHRSDEPLALFIPVTLRSNTLSYTYTVFHCC
ncbi:unnamed protein product, partial [Timema podura]|nr:unnamed protein product [Timema podura]